MKLLIIVTIILFMSAYTTLQMGISLMLNVLTLTLFMSMVMLNGWMAMVVFLSYMGGMLVLIMYVCTMSCNPKFKSSLTVAPMLIMFSSVKSVESHQEGLGAMYLLYYGNNMVLFSMVYLLLGLFALIQICSKHSGPMKL